MCGIIGHIGNNNSARNALEGLKLLEYRGYDSSGLSTFDQQGKLRVIKKTGRVGVLLEAVESLNIDSSVALAHTRWATHGKASDLNAHPHQVGDIALVHNGIIENFAELKEQVVKLGAVVVSETDTEIIAHLISMETGTLLERVTKTLPALKGSYALAVMSEKEPDCIVVARNASPLIIGQHDKGSVIASDTQALLAFTNKVAVLEDGEVAVVKKDGIEFYSSGIKVEKEFRIVPWTSSATELGKFDTYMKKEISEQPMVIFDTMLKNDWSKWHSYLGKLFEGGIEEVVFVACGTSYHACMIGAHLIERTANIRASVKMAGEFRSNNYLIGHKTLLIAVSQSGETADTLNAVKDARQRGAKTLALVNVMNSSMEREVDSVIYTAAGPEISVASTKAFTSQLVVLYLLASLLKNLKVPYNSATNTFNHLIGELGLIPDRVKQIFEQDDEIKKLALKLCGHRSALYIGRGLGFPIALEGALKLKEISYIHAEGLAGSELKHGSIALIEKGTPVIALAVEGFEYDKLVSNIQEVKARGAWVLSIATEGQERICEWSDEVIFIPKVDELLAPLLAIVPLQLLAYHTAKALGLDLDRPRNLAKSVSVE